MIAVQPKSVWLDVCALEDIAPDTGVCALVDGQQVAIIRAGARVYAIDNFDPFSCAYVISRGLVGDHHGVPTIASPIYKNVFDLATGTCLDEPSVKLRVWRVRVEDGRVAVEAD